MDPARIFTYAEKPTVTPRIDLRIPVEIMEYYRVFPRPQVTPEFVADIRENGIRQPLRIYTDGERAVLRDGHHRLAAAMAVGNRPVVPVQIWPNWLGNLYVGIFEPMPVEKTLAAWLTTNHNAFRHTNHLVTELSHNSRLSHQRCSCGADWRIRREHPVRESGVPLEPGDLAASR